MLDEWLKEEAGNSEGKKMTDAKAPMRCFDDDDKNEPTNTVVNTVGDEKAMIQNLLGLKESPGKPRTASRSKEPPNDSQQQDTARHWAVMM